eukprot:GABV01009567.1.p1 GENE.GABV01009567.1~~GABV01009567.1.p1  ORF type:complete len:209 (-),score=35.06 GABV01009567.1:27-653(-)
MSESLRNRKLGGRTRGSRLRPAAKKVPRARQTDPGLKPQIGPRKIYSLETIFKYREFDACREFPDSIPRIPNVTAKGLGFTTLDEGETDLAKVTGVSSPRDSQRPASTRIVRGGPQLAQNADDVKDIQRPTTPPKKPHSKCLPVLGGRRVPKPMRIHSLLLPNASTAFSTSLSPKGLTPSVSSSLILPSKLCLVLGPPRTGAPCAARV